MIPYHGGAEESISLSFGQIARSMCVYTLKNALVHLWARELKDLGLVKAKGSSTVRENLLVSV